MDMDIEVIRIPGNDAEPREGRVATLRCHEIILTVHGHTIVDFMVYVPEESMTDDKVRHLTMAELSKIEPFIFRR